MSYGSYKPYLLHSLSINDPLSTINNLAVYLRIWLK